MLRNGPPPGLRGEEVWIRQKGATHSERTYLRGTSSAPTPLSGRSNRAVPNGLPSFVGSPYRAFRWDRGRRRRSGASRSGRITLTVTKARRVVEHGHDGFPEKAGGSSNASSLIGEAERVLRGGDDGVGEPRDAVECSFIAPHEAVPGAEVSPTGSWILRARGVRRHGAQQPSARWRHRIRKQVSHECGRSLFSSCAREATRQSDRVVSVQSAHWRSSY